MTRLHHTLTLQDTTKIVREFARLDVEIDKPSKPTPLYWRLGGRRDLIEVGVHRETGRLLSMAVPIYSGQLAHAASRSQAPPRVTEGVPGFDRGLWPPAVLTGGGTYGEDFVDNEGEFHMRMCQDELVIDLSPARPAYRIVAGAQLACDFDEHGELCAFVLLHLTPQELSVIEDEYGQAGGP